MARLWNTPNQTMYKSKTLLEVGYGLHHCKDALKAYPLFP